MADVAARSLGRAAQQEPVTAMHPRVEKLPAPQPDYQRFLATLRREPVARVPLIELAVHHHVVDELLGIPADQNAAAPPDRYEMVRRSARLHHRLGYDVFKVSAPIPFEIAHRASDDQRTWANVSEGPVKAADDIDKFPWPAADDVDFSTLDAAMEILPAEMKLIGFAGGVLEFSMDLVGMERFMIATRRDKALVGGVVERVGQIVYDVFRRYCEYESVCALWLGDDLGFKSGLLVSPKFLEEHVFPWYRRFAELAHEHDRPLLLHSCGNIARIMPDLVETVGIDAKHSFEDAIQPVEQFYDEWHDRIAVLGGVDVHLLATASEDEIADRTRQILMHTADRGGYACGSGNSITDYVPAANYLAMVEAAHEFNEKRG